MQGRSRFPHDTPLQVGIALARPGAYQMPWQGQTGLADRTDRRDQGQHHRRQGFVGLGGVVFVRTSSQVRSEEADQVTSDWANAFVAMRLPAAFPKDHPLPDRQQRSEVPVSILQGSDTAAYHLFWQSQVVQSREEGSPTEQEAS